MKRYLIFMLFIILIAITQACTTDEVKNPPPEVSAENDYSKDSVYSFTHFELDVDFGVNQSYDAEYENEENGMEADIEDKLTNSSLNGNEAFEVLEPKFKQLTFDQQTQDGKVIAEVLKAFGLKEDYIKFKLEVKFNDGTEKEYEDK